MTRLDIITTFRNENPEVTQNVISDSVLQGWLLRGNIEVCCMTLCIATNTTVTFNAVVGQQYYDLEANIQSFFAINDMPGGGVYFNNLPLVKATPAEMNYIKKTWKTSANGIPIRYWRNGKYLWLERPPANAYVIGVDAFLIPQPFNQDTQTPFNQLGHLTPYHDALSKYLQYKCKEKIGKDDEGAKAQAAYMNYVKWMKKEVKGGNQSQVFMRPASYNSGIPRY